jgi:hypothetical protein
MTACGYRRDEAHTMAGAGRVDYWSFTPLAPDATRVAIRAYMGGVSEENLGFAALCKALIFGYSFLSHC